MGRKRSRQGKHLHLFLACLILIGISGCTGVQGMLAKPDYWQADQQLVGGNYAAALEQYREINRLYPRASDEGLFKIGCIYAHPKNPNRDYQKSLEAFRRLISEYPRSRYRVPSETAAAVVTELTNQEKRTSDLKKRADTLEKQVETLTNRGKRASTLKKHADTLEKQVETLEKQIEQLKEIDRSLEEQKRKLPPR